MKVVILAGGLGTRLAEETDIKPKPMVEVGGRPVLWHIMKHYARHGHDEFYIALGYRGEVIKRYFAEYALLSSDFTVDLKGGAIQTRTAPAEAWRVQLIDTGRDTNTGGRLKRLAAHLGGGSFLLTYGDGLSDVDVNQVIALHQREGRHATVTAVRPPARFGGIVFAGHRVAEFTEKPQIGEGWINGGFFVFEPAFFQYLDDDASSLEAHGLERCCRAGQLSAFRHEGYWQCMDTLREVNLLRRLWEAGEAPWKTW